MTCHNCRIEMVKAGLYGRNKVQRYKCQQCVIDHLKTFFLNPRRSSNIICAEGAIIRRSSSIGLLSWIRGIMPEWNEESVRLRPSSARDSVAPWTAGRCSRCVPVATVDSGTAVNHAGSRSGASNCVQPTTGINGATKADSLTATASEAIGSARPEFGLP